MTQEPRQKPNHLRWDPLRRARKAAQMRGNSNASSSKFSQDLIGEFGNDQELRKWIEEHASDLDSPNTDGSLPLSDTQILDGDSHGPKKDYGDERPLFYPETD